MKIETYWGPDTPAEIQAKSEIAKLQREYQAKAQPYVDIIAKEHAKKLPRYSVTPEPGDKWEPHLS
ncbi:MAG TPA: hypothetical protein VIU82_22040 [Bosea sp. (in: a-proteobacteria)]